jgi:hypothetical protein
MRSVKSAEFKYWLMDSRDKVCFPPHVSMREGKLITSSLSIIFSHDYHTLTIDFDIHVAIWYVGLYRDEFRSDAQVFQEVRQGTSLSFMKT